MAGEETGLSKGKVVWLLHPAHTVTARVRGRRWGWAMDDDDHSNGNAPRNLRGTSHTVSHSLLAESRAAGMNIILVLETKKLRSREVQKNLPEVQPV